MKQLVFVLIAIALIGGGYLFFSQSNKSSSASQTMQETTVPSSSSTPLSSSSSVSTESRTIDVEAGSFYYKPNMITAKKGETIKIVMRSVSMMHDFNIDELGVKMPIVKNGDTGTVTFTPDKVGTFEYYCSVGKHRAMGQVGKLIVE